MPLKQSSRLLIDEPALQVLPSLAVAVGLNEAIVLQQVHYWLRNAEANRRHDNYQDGRWWVYNSYPEWKRDAFPWWSEDTIQRVFKNLEKKGLLITGKLSNNPYDQRKWYSIDYDALDALNLRSSITATCVDALPQNAPMDDSKMRSSHHRKMRSSITENKTTTETTVIEVAAPAAPPPPPPPAPSEPKTVPQPASPKKTGRAAQETPEETAYYRACVPVMARAAELDLKVDGVWAQCQKALRALYHAEVRPTPDLIEREFVRRDGYWYTQFWKGRDKNEPPEPHDFPGNWKRAMTWRSKPSLSVVNGQPRAAPPQEDGIAALRARLTGQPPDGSFIEGRFRHG